MDLARRRVVIASDDGWQFDCRRVYFHWSRRFPVLAVKESLSESLPVTFKLSHDRLARRTSRSFSHGMEARPVLHGVLLASDATAFRGWRNESVVDHRAGCLCIIGTDCAKELASIASIGSRPALLRSLVSFLGEAGLLSGSRERLPDFTAKRLTQG